MFSGISITCFASSYAVAMALEATRLAFRSSVRSAVMIGFAVAGIFAHTAFLYYRAVSTAGAPLASQRDWYLVAAWGLAATYLYLTCCHPKTAIGLFVLPLVFGLLGLAVFVADAEPYSRQTTLQFWGIVHGTSILLATVAVLVGFAAGLMYLRQASRLKHKRPPRRNLRLPSLEWLERTNSRAIVVSAGMLGLGVASGVVLNLNRGTGAIPWDDPAVLATLLMFGWLGGSAAVGMVYRPARRGRHVAYLTIVSGVFLVIALVLLSLLVSQHGGARGGGSDGSAPPHARGSLRSGSRPIAAADEPRDDEHSPGAAWGVAA